MKIVLYCGVLLCLLVACEEEQIPFPKERLYPKVDYPERNYSTLNKEFCNFSFNYPDYMKYKHDSMLVNEKAKHPCWFTLEFPSLGGSLHMTYTDISGEGSSDKLYDVIKDAYALSEQHNPKSTGRDDQPYHDADRGIYGITFGVSGDVASPYHFVLTDSLNHSLWGSLYFNAKPNSDSLRPVVDFVREDIDKILSSFKWLD
ncbi:MAG: gliding motility protein GldD [Aureispira sp.]|nr:gliding motility protein GldD [Aureispira sp.]